jgi:hypothetical protein|tara:strand:+ start:564 stop:1118 length:555 start_codon:yes stop_codon:yes gene_type:complete
MALSVLKTSKLNYQEACEFFDYKENEIKFQQKITEFEQALTQSVKEDNEEEFNRSITGEIEGAVTHNFADGQYIRTIVMPKGLVVTTKIHNQNHPFFIMTGEVSIFSEQGVQQIKAPYHGITKRGTKRVLYVHEECVFITVHCTDKLDLKEVEEECIAKNFSEVNKVPIDIKQIDKLIQQVEKR